MDPRLELSTAKDDQWWGKLKNIIVPLLESFNKATNIIQSNSATLLDVNVAINGMIYCINNINISDGLGV